MKQFSKCICLLLSLALLAVSGCAAAPDAADDSTPSTTTTTTVSTDDTTTTAATAVTTTTASSPSADPAPDAEVAFRENTNVRLDYDAAGLEYPARFGGHVLVSKAQFDGMKLDALELFDFGTKEQVVDLASYTEAYFADKALVVLFMTSGAGNAHMRVDKLTVSGDTLTVAYTEQRPMVIENDGSDWCLLLEVDAAAVQNVTAVVGEKTEETLPED